MPPITCPRCGALLPADPRTARSAPHCSPRCAVLAEMKVDTGGNYPVTPLLLAALATAFLTFNQLLFWSLAAVLTAQERPGPAANMAAVSHLAGAVVWLALAAWLWRFPGRRSLTLVLLALTAAGGLAGFMMDAPAMALLANGMLWIACATGLFRKKSPGKASVPFDGRRP